MTIALQAHVASMRARPLPHERREGPASFLTRPYLQARLRFDAIASAKMAINQNDLLDPVPEGSQAFLAAQHACRRKDGRLVAVIGEPILSDSGVSGMATRTSASDLLDLYEIHGSDFVKLLRGTWAIVLVDPANDLILLANDRMGRQTLYYRLRKACISIASSMEGLRNLDRVTELDPQALYNYTYFHMVPAQGAVIRGCSKLSAASMLLVGTKGSQLLRHWSPVFRESRVGTQTHAHAELKACLKASVRRCLVPEKSGGRERKVGAFLSGGLDSSTVAGMLSELQAGGCDAYGIGFDAAGYDEMGYARIVAGHFGIRLHEHRVSPEEVVQALPELAAASDEPFGNSSVVPAFFCARLAAKDGIDVLLAGDGGDELFAGNTRYAGQQFFEDYRKSPQWLRSRVVEPLLGMLPHAFPLASKGHSFLRQVGTELPQRLQYYNFLEQNSPQTVFAADFLSTVDLHQPTGMLRDTYHLPEGASVLNRMMFLDWQYTLADNDLRKVSHACSMAGVAVRYPMLDDELVEFSTTIPSAWKLPGSSFRGRGLRYFYKQSLAGWLPAATIMKAKHGFGLPFGIWMRSHTVLQELVLDNIVGLKARGIFQSGFLDQAIVRHREGHAAYYGELLWVLVCLELWLQAHRPDYRFGHTS